MTTAQKPDALPVVAHLLEESRRWKARALTTTDRAMAEREAQARNDGSTVSALVRLSDAQASLLAKEAECEALRVKAARYDWLLANDRLIKKVVLELGYGFGAALRGDEYVNEVLDEARALGKDAWGVALNSSIHAAQQTTRGQP